MSLVIKTGAHMKVPIPGLDYASQGFSCEIQVDDPPAEVRESKEALKKYLEALFRECRNRVRDQVDRASAQREENSAPRSRPQARHRPMRGPIGRDNGRGGNGGSNGRSNGEYASGKQLAFLKRLAQDRGLGYGGLQELARDEFGTDDVLRLTKRQASRLIDELRPEDRQ